MQKKTYTHGIALLIAGAMLANRVIADEVPEVIASIKPLAAIAEAIAGESVVVKVLLPANISPHDYSLKFSDLRALRSAKLIIWIGPHFESVLQKPLAQRSDSQLQIAELNGLIWPPEHTEKTPEHSHGHAHDGLTRDLHVWLNPINGIVIARAIAAELTRKYPAKQAIFDQNLEAFTEVVTQLDSVSRQRLAGLRERGFIVMHDGYSHFVAHYGLTQLAMMQLSSGVTQGIRHYGQMLALGQQVGCVFSEPQLDSKAAHQLAQQLGAKSAELDPLGIHLDSVKGGYPVLIEGVVDAFVSCLSE